ncbi:acyl carrier protein [Streptomyces apocyni]|uniref:acyl carrier protein n=1 Tax=Streptomyces apocyni TaxID=2654677 RepID=UPI0012EAC40E|nr:acyl carrier protein [Streptomyces apocyni]
MTEQAVSAAYLERYPDQLALRASDFELRTHTIADYICQELGRFLEIPPAHRVSASRSLRSQGVGSITALKLRRTLEDALGIEVSAVDLLRDITVAEVAALLASRLDGPTVEQFAAAGGRKP